MADYKAVSQSASDEQTSVDDIDFKVVNKIVSNVFLMVTLQLTAYYDIGFPSLFHWNLFWIFGVHTLDKIDQERGKSSKSSAVLFPELIFLLMIRVVVFMYEVGIGFLMNQPANVLELIAKDYYHSALLMFIATSFVFISTRKYHRSFPRNLLFVPLPVGGLGVIFMVQLVRFGLHQAARSDVPALLFLLFTCCLFTMVTRSSFFPYKCWWRGSGIYLILTLLVASGVVPSFRLQEDFRYLSLIIMSICLLYLVMRTRVLVLSKGFNTAPSDAIHVYLDLLVVPLAVVSGPITFAYFYVMPHNYGI